MDYSIKIEFKNNYLHVAVSGNNTLKNVLAYLDDVYAECLKYQTGTVMIEEFLIGPELDTFEIFEVIMKNFNKARAVNLRLAYVDLNKEHDKRGLRFAENLAHIRGVNVRLFFETEPALKWLLTE